MSHDCPNRLCVGKNDSTYGTHFGMPYAAVPMHHVEGRGHIEHIKLSFSGGLALELTRATAIEIARRLPEAIAALPPDLNGADVGGAFYDIKEAE